MSFIDPGCSIAQSELRCFVVMRLIYIVASFLNKSIRGPLLSSGPVD